MSQTQFHLNDAYKDIKSNGFINVYSIDKVLLNQYVSAREAGRNLNMSDSTIGKYARRGLLYKNMYYFSFDLLYEGSLMKQINKLLL